MFQGMSEKHWKDRLADERSRDRKEIDDWMYGPGGKVLGVMIVLLGIWFVVRMFWS